MRAAYANGVLAALEDAGYRDFDAVYGTSAGGALAAWFSAGQARFAVGTWEYAQDRRILSYRRWATGRGALLDHDRLFEIVYEKHLDIAKLKAAPWPVVVTVVDADTGQTRYVDVRTGDVLAWLRATGRLPLAAGEPVEIEGKRWLDGGLTDPIPLARAIEDGAKEILLILNRPPGERKPEPPISAWLVGRRFPKLTENVKLHHEHHNRAIRLAAAPPPGVHVDVIRPRRDTGVRRFTRDVKTILKAAQTGEADGRAWLAGDTGIPVEMGPT